MRPNQRNKGGWNGTYSPFTAGRMQFPVVYISETTRPSRGSPRKKKGTTPKFENKRRKQMPRRVVTLRSFNLCEAKVSATGVRLSARGAVEIPLVPNLKN